MRQGITDAVKHLLIINVLMYIGMMTVGHQGEPFSTWFALHFPKTHYFNLGKC